MNNYINAKFIPPKISGFREEISDNDFKYFCRLIEDTTGINIGSEKKALVTSRLNKRLRILALDSYSDYVRHLEQNEGELSHFVNALTTNKTDFFRENAHFTFLKHFYLSRRPFRPVYLWSAACSSGAEVYSLAIVLNEIKESFPEFEYRILGSDVDSEMLERTEKGVYHSSELIGMPSFFLRKYFLTSYKEKNRDKYKICNDLIKHVKIRSYNLINSSDLSMKFDIIFLRNVLIYFSTANIQRVVGKMSRHLRKKGLLFIGHSENLTTVNHDFKQLGPSIFRKN